MDNSDTLYTIERPGLKGRIRLSLEAQDMARMNGMTLTELAKHLLQQDSLRRSGLAQRDGEN